MRSARITVDPAFVLAPVERRLFGTFVEHMGRCVYTGIYEPEHPTADDHGFREDVLELVRELGPTVVRYPGGNFVSGYRWEDGVGPVSERPRRLDLAWRSIETNEVGLNEFLGWAQRAGIEPMLAVNLGTRGVQEAAELIEYSNHPSGTTLSDLRIAHGVKEPHDVRLWCLGNELDARWQIGAKTPQEYGRLAAETGKAMRLVDPEIKLVAVGSSKRAMPLFGQWEATVLEHTYDYVDYISLHAYYEQIEDDLTSFLASAVDMDRFIEAVVATADHVGAKLRRDKRLKLSFDEWNVWYEGDFVGAPQLQWEETPRLIEDEYSVADAVVVGDLLITLLRHADRVGMACQAQLVNVIAPIRTEPGGPAWRQTTFHPFARTSQLARGVVLRTEVSGPGHFTERYGDVATVNGVVTWDEDEGSLVLFAVNRDPREPVQIVADVQRFGNLVPSGSVLLADVDHRARNTLDDPDRVVPRPLDDVRLDHGRLTAVLPPVSWAAVQLDRPSTQDATPYHRTSTDHPHF